MQLASKETESNIPTLNLLRDQHKSLGQITNNLHNIKLIEKEQEVEAINQEVM